MSERELSLQRKLELEKSVKYYSFKAAVEAGNQDYQAELLVYPLKKTLERPEMRDFIRLFDPSTMEVVATADDIRELNTNASLVANILGNTYPATEMLVFYPASQFQAVSFSRTLNQIGILGRARKSMVFETDNASRTLPGGFYYEYSGTFWKQRPKILPLGKKPIILKEGLPSREDMQFSLSRRADYRVPAEMVEDYMARPIEERAASFVDALEIHSSGTIKTELESTWQRIFA